MRRGLMLLLVVAGCAPIAPAPRIVPQPGPMVDPRIIWLNAHNRERAAFGSRPLVWDASLAAQARAYASELAQLGRLQHAPKARRPGQGENLWMGSRGAYVPEAMVASWASERRWFRHGIFPAVSTTGRWSDVGHYTQIVWPRTSRLGCGMASSARWDVLVCRYSPPGNQDGTRI